MSRDRRKKASDVFSESKSFFGERVSFAQAFPQIKHIVVKVYETGDGVRPLLGDRAVTGLLSRFIPTGSTATILFSFTFFPGKK